MEPLPVAERMVVHSLRLVRARGLSIHAAAFGLLGALSFAAARAFPRLSTLTGAGLACPFRAATGVPCPSCGATHAFVALARGHLGDGLFASPLFALAALALWAWALWIAARLVGAALGRSFTLALPTLDHTTSRSLRLAALGLVLANWLFVIWVSRGGAP